MQQGQLLWLHEEFEVDLQLNSVRFEISGRREREINASMAAAAAACNLGTTSNIQLSNLDFTRSHNLRTMIRPRPTQHHLPFKRGGLVLSRSSATPLPQTAKSLEDDLEGKKCVAVESQMVPNSFEVESLLMEICDTATIAEFELKFDGFRLYVTRDLAGKNRPPPSTSPPVNANVSIQAPDLTGSVSSQSLTISKATPPGDYRTLQEKATDEGLVILKSPRVGFFRRSRTIKGKRAPPPCKENQIVKEGQVLCYIEQLGGEIPIESDVAGEVVKILKKDGEPVGYGDALLEILPSFPGIKKLQ